MKKIVLAAALIFALAASMPALAQYHHGYNGGYRGNYNGHYNRGHGGNNAAWFIGGALVGSLATQAYDNNRRTVYYNQPYVIYYRDVPVYCRDAYGYTYQCGTQTIREP